MDGGAIAEECFCMGGWVGVSEVMLVGGWEVKGGTGEEKQPSEEQLSHGQTGALRSTTCR